MKVFKKQETALFFLPTLAGEANCRKRTQGASDKTELFLAGLGDRIYRLL